MKNLFIFLAMILPLAACSHPEKTFEADLSLNQCDQALKHLPSEDPLNKASDQAKLIAGNLASYTATGAGYTTQIIWNIASGTVVVVALCGPMIAAQMSSQTRLYSPAVSTCLPGFNSLDAIMAPPLGKNAWKGTSELRCPDLKGVSASLKKVATCYERKGDTESLKKAVDSLENIEMSKHFFSCLSPEDQTAITTYRESLTKRLPSEALVN